MTDYTVEGGSWRVRDMPERLRPREEMLRLGVQNVSDDVLLAIVLRSGAVGENVSDLAKRILRDYGSFTALSASSVDELASGNYRGLGPVKAQVLIAALEIGKRLSEEALPRKFRIRSPQDAVRIVRERARSLDTEVFWVLMLDAKNQLKGRPVDVTQGLLDASLVHPREVFREAVRSATAAVVLAHNHPSGDPTPSSDDVAVTRQLVEAGKIMDIKVLDHVVVGKRTEGGDKEFVSMKEEGLVQF
jgi:DNA repair protein RadC